MSLQLNLNFPKIQGWRYFDGGDGHGQEWAGFYLSYLSSTPLIKVKP